MAYEHTEIETKWTEYWIKREVFDLDIIPDRPRFSIALPPPNITGNLHMGHALNGTLQDVLIRLKRMQGYNVLWQPGTDHASISTQMVVERQLRKQGIKRREMGREAFLKEVWKWRVQYGDSIMSQYKRLGVSFNWDRIAFTMDDSYLKAVYRAFVTLFQDGFIYRGNRVSNWCPSCLTTVSDLEVIHIETKGHLYFVEYWLEDKSAALCIATTRPETILADVAVAVHPADDRYKSFVGKNVLMPITGKPLPVIADNYVDREFGTGALKITPGHDVNDWEVGQRHNLPTPVVMGEEARLLANELVPERYQNKDRFVVREEIVKDMQELGLMREIQDYVHSVGHCERSNTVIEPLLSDQWYVSMKDLAGPAITCVEEERVVFFPERYTATYIDWLKNVRDWCISRQLWWGQRIPVWTCSNKHVEAYEEPPEQCKHCDSKSLEQDPDVLDTWFSSGLWPFATLGWPEETREMKEFYPTTALCTAREIINLWVSRMIFMSLKLVKTIPFKHVLIHPVIQTHDGKRMSKSKGNAVDPIDMIEKYGADANRFWFASIGIKGDQDVRFREDRLEEYKRFVNKLWNAGRFVIDKLEGTHGGKIDHDKLTVADRWILHRYNKLLQVVQESYNNYDYQIASRELYEFTWDQFCDWYVEIAKIQLRDPEQGSQTKSVLYFVFEGLLRALHPTMPFITEELWSQLPKSEFSSALDSIMFAPFPRDDSSLHDEKSEQEMDFLIRIIRSLRNIKQTYGIPPKVDAEAILEIDGQSDRAVIETGHSYIESLALVKLKTKNEPNGKPKRAATDTQGGTKIFVPLETLIDVDKTKDKLEKRKQAVEKEVQRTRDIVSNEDFKAKAPPEKVDALVKQLDELEEQLNNIVSQLKVLE